MGIRCWLPQMGRAQGETRRTCSCPAVPLPASCCRRSADNQEYVGSSSHNGAGATCRSGEFWQERRLFDVSWRASACPLATCTSGEYVTATKKGGGQLRLRIRDAWVALVPMVAENVDLVIFAGSLRDVATRPRGRVPRGDDCSGRPIEAV